MCLIQDLLAATPDQLGQVFIALDGTSSFLLLPPLQVLEVEVPLEWLGDVVALLGGRLMIPQKATFYIRLMFPFHFNIIV
jgi:hypothetical protein